MKLANMTGQEMLQAIDAMKKSLDNLDLLANISLQIAVDHNVRRKLDMLTAVKQLYRWKQGGEKPEVNAASVFNPHDGIDKTNIYYIFKELRKGMPWEIRRDYLVVPFALTLTLFDTLNTLFPCPEVTRGMMLNQRFINKITLPKYRPDISETEAQEKRDRYMRELDDLERDFEKLYEDLALFFTRQIDPDKDKVVKNIDTINTTVKRIDDRARRQAEDDATCEERRKAESECLALWVDYLDGKFGPRINSGKASYKDLLFLPRVASQLSKLGITDAISIQKAVRNAKNRE